MFLQRDPHVLYLGMSYPYHTFLLFEAQAWYAREIVLGRRTLPSADARADDLAEWQAAERKARTGDDELELQTRYVADLLDASDYPPVDLKALAAIFQQVEVDKERDIVRYRDATMTSVFTGTEAASPHRPWIEAFDDGDETA